ncbi:helix-turn-helix domain-containing protein [Bordetella bronchialis]|uniref:helix-turn-helix domain-containing protein n=1 Tax=Bordetella bronchialis TaxID=463025 RepID=UPI003D06A6FA
MSLAHLVRYDASDWTAFASIEYLAKVTHLNRKTVIEALGRLRELGAIVDTGMRAGSNRGCVVYRLCPNAVPTIDFGAAPSYAGGHLQGRANQGGLDLTGDDNRGDVGADGPPAVTEEGTPASLPLADPVACGEESTEMADTPAYSSTGHVPPTAVSAFVGASHVTSSNLATAATNDTDAFRATAQAHPRHQTRHPPRASPGEPAGAGATRLPQGWTLPDRWRAWTCRERPHWSDEKIEAIAATFSAYWRTKAGQDGFSANWFESWRLWVFRERGDARQGCTPWHGSWSGIVAKGRSLGLHQEPDEPAPNFRARVLRAADLPPN